MPDTLKMALAVTSFHFLGRTLHLGELLLAISMFLNQVEKIVTHRLQIVTEGMWPTS